jgi:pimeloyl-ACP methyl ester carboxylesterase
VWGTRDKHFTIGLGRRLAAAFPHAQLDTVGDAKTFVPIDRPGAVAQAVREVSESAYRAARPRPPR